MSASVIPAVRGDVVHPTMLADGFKMPENRRLTPIERGLKMDGATIAGAFAAGSHIAGLVKGIAATLKAAGKSESLAELIELQMAMLSVIQKQNEVVDENRRLRRRIRKLRLQLDISSRVEFHENCYWLRLNETTLDGPFSMLYWDTNGRLLRLMNCGPGKSETGIEFMQFGTKETEEYVRVDLSFLKRHNVTKQFIADA